MAEAKYTPGPWHVGEPPFGEIVYGSDPSEGPGAQILVADCWPPVLAERWHWRKKTASANARLIASAPELLAACESLVAAKTSTNGDMADVIAAMDLAEAAVKKAKGE